MSFDIYVANMRGMCAGVKRAIDVVNIALNKYGEDKIFVLHEVVHNKHVVLALQQRGAVFVDTLDEIPSGKIVIFSAHGVGLDVIEEAQKRNLKIIDATCPLVKRIHLKMNNAGKNHQEAIVIGHRGHQEVIGTIGQYMGDKSLVHVVENEDDVKSLKVVSDNLIFATQTTLSVDETAKTVAALRQRFTTIEGPKTDDTCFATQLRQVAIKELAKSCDLILVAGSKNSSNSNRLAEVAKSQGCISYLIDDYSFIEDDWLKDVKSVGVSAGASVPEYIVTDIITYLKTKSAKAEVKYIGQEQRNLTFPLPEI